MSESFHEPSYFPGPYPAGQDPPLVPEEQQADAAGLGGAQRREPSVATATAAEHPPTRGPLHRLLLVSELRMKSMFHMYLPSGVMAFSSIGCLVWGCRGAVLGEGW